MSEIKWLDLIEKITDPEIEFTRAEGKALTLSDEEMDLLRAFRRFKLRMRKNPETFTWNTRMPEGVQLVEETAEIFHPAEAPEFGYSARNSKTSDRCSISLRFHRPPTN